MTPAILRYQAQIQEQQQEVPAAPAAAATGGTPPPAAESVDALIGDILKSGKPEPGDSDDDGDEPAEADEGVDADGEDGDPSEEVAEHEDDDTTAEDDAAEDDDAAEAPEPDAAALKAARKALKEGDLDKAFQLAFGMKPEQVQPDAKAWTSWRKANERKDAQIAQERQGMAAQAQQNHQWLQGQVQQLNATIEQYKPYEPYAQLGMAFAKDGDPAHLVKLVELAAKTSYDDAQKLILTRTRRSPGERALQERLDAIERQRSEEQRQLQEHQQKAQQQQLYQSDLQTIRGQVQGEVTKVPQYAERIYNVLLKTRSPAGLTLTPAQAGERVLAAERRKLAKHPLLKQAPARPASPVSQAASTLAKARKGKAGAGSPPLRRDSHGNGATDDKTESVDDIIADIIKKPGTVRRVAR
jgi:hypothetical protein